MRLIKLVIAVLCLSCLWAYPANAQCKPGDILVGEDAKRWYCEAKLTVKELEELASDLRNYLAHDGPSEEWLGKEWQYRKALIGAALDIAKNRKWLYGAKVSFTVDGKTREICVADPKECKAHEYEEGRYIDCSGLAEHGASSACFTTAYATATCGKVIAKTGLGNNATNQMMLFKENGVFVPRSGTPKPGDFIFFNLDKQFDPNIATHVAIYLAKRTDGKIWMLHAGKNVVGPTNMPSHWSGKTIGYGNISKLIVNFDE